MVVLIVILSIILSVFLVWKVPQWQLAGRKGLLEAKDYANIENEYRRTIAQIIGALYVLAGLGFTWNQLVATQDTLVLAQDRLITDRYSKAIDQLGSDKLQTRLGGIYALGKITESSKEYVTVVNNVLASYVRQNYTKTDFASVEELQAAIDIITFKNMGKQDVIPDSNKLYLAGVVLKNYKFDHSFLAGAFLTNADLSEGSFINANLSSVQCTDGKFINTNFTGATLKGATLYGSDFSAATMNNALLVDSDLRLCTFKETDLSNSDLSGADLREAELNGAILMGTNLKGANLQNVTGLTPDQIRKAIVNDNTKLPNLK